MHWQFVHLPSKIDLLLWHLCRALNNKVYEPTKSITSQFCVSATLFYWALGYRDVLCYCPAQAAKVGEATVADVFAPTN